jgi:AraC-like DNA-binding protein
MNVHKNARLTPVGRALMADRIEQGWSAKAAAEAAGVSTVTAYQWRRRHRLGGERRHHDRSSAPRRCPRKTPQPRVAEVLSRLPFAGETCLLDLTMEALHETVRLGLEAVGAIARAPASRPSVRRELFRRAAQVRTVIEAQPERNDGLDALGKIACLSPFHLHRAYRAAFGETPAQMRRRLRIAQAQRLLVTGARPIAEIAQSVGYHNCSAFSRTFSVAVGVTPMDFRRAAGL